VAGAPLFLYGTLLDPRVFARFAGRRPLRRAMPACLPGFRRLCLRGTPYPTLAAGPGEVAGLLLPRLAPAAMGRLSAYEGASYRLIPLRVLTARGPRRARGWAAAAWRAGPAPWRPARECERRPIARRDRETSRLAAAREWRGPR
jgi:hypothetical protein